ncbi:unnamed protein product, partial [Effrenium voratum]
MEAVHDPWALSSSAWRSDHEVWPVGLYGDEASMGFVGGGPVEKIIGLFLNIPLHRPASTRLSRFLIFSISSEYVVSAQDTFYPVFDAIVRSLNAASTGVDPQRFLVSELRGDQAWFRYIFRHRSHWSAIEICPRCSASSKGPMVYSGDYKETPAWAATMRFIVDQCPLPHCPLVGLRFFAVSLLKHCTLHICNLGLCATASGSCLLMLICMGVFGPATPEDVRGALNTSFDDFSSWRNALRRFFGLMERSSRTAVKAAEIARAGRRFIKEHLRLTSMSAAIPQLAWVCTDLACWDWRLRSRASVPLTSLRPHETGTPPSSRLPGPGLGALLRAGVRKIDPGIQSILRRKAVVYAHCSQGHTMQSSEGNWSVARLVFSAACGICKKGLGVERKLECTSCGFFLCSSCDRKGLFRGYYSLGSMAATTARQLLQEPGWIRYKARRYLAAAGQPGGPLSLDVWQGKLAL